MLATRNDVVECFRTILGREPEDDARVEWFLSKQFEKWALIQAFLDCEERKLREDAGIALSLTKCYRKDYIAKFIHKDTRNGIFLDNLAFLRLNLKHRIFEEVLHRDVILLEKERCDVTIQFARDIFTEGEISIKARYNGRDIYVCSFTFVRGHLLSIDREWVILISRLQGYIGTKDLNVHFAKSFGGIPSRYVLLHALAGIATSSDINVMLGVDAKNQVCSNEAMEIVLRKNYDDFFCTFKDVERGDGFFRLNVPLESKNILEIRETHRARARERRRLKADIAESTEARWSALVRTVNAVSRKGEERQGRDSRPFGRVFGPLQRLYAKLTAPADQWADSADGMAPQGYEADDRTPHHVPLAADASDPDIVLTNR